MDKNIRILYPILHYPPVIGGLEQWSQNIAERQPSDTEIFVVTGRIKGESNFEKKGNVTIFRTSFFALTNLSHSSLIYIAGAIPLIFFRSLLLSKDIKLFHCHGFISAIMGCLLSALSGKPFFCTEQSIKLRNPVSKFLAHIVYKKAIVCVASSCAVAEEFKKIGVKKIEVIPNGVDLRKFNLCAGLNPAHSSVRGSTPHIGDEFVILSVGRLEKVKGHKYLIEAFSHIKKAIPNARLILIGDGSERKNLEKQADELGISGNIEFAGEIPHNELPRWYHGADIFVMPSLSEGFGITAIEAMACGVPVIATSVGGLLDIVRDRKTGICVNAGDSGMLASAIIELIRDSEIKASIAQAAWQSAQNYSWDRISARVGVLYRAVQKI